MMAVAAGAADVDGVGGRLDGDEAGAHLAGGGGDLDIGLAALGQRDEERGDGLVADRAVEDRGEGVRGLGLVEGQGRIGQGGQ